MTVDDIIRSALTKLGVIPIGEAVPAEFTAMALTEINALLQEWAAQGLKLHALTKNTVTLTASTPSYTIGTGGVFDVRRPVELVDAVLTVSAGAFRPLSVYNTLFRYRTYSSLPVGVPQEVYYDPAFTLGALTFYPTPDANYAVDLYSWVSLVPFAASTDTVALPPEYEGPLGLSLAVRLMPTFGKQDALLVTQAQLAETTLMANNSKRLIRSPWLDSMHSPVQPGGGVTP